MEGVFYVALYTAWWALVHVTLWKLGDAEEANQQAWESVGVGATGFFACLIFAQTATLLWLQPQGVSLVWAVVRALAAFGLGSIALEEILSPRLHSR